MIFYYYFCRALTVLFGYHLHYLYSIAYFVIPFTVAFLDAVFTSIVTLCFDQVPFNQWISIIHENKRPTTYNGHYLPFSQFIYDQWNIKTLWIHSRNRDGLNFYFYPGSLFQSCKSIVRTSFRHEYLSRQRGLILKRWKLTKAPVALKNCDEKERSQHIDLVVNRRRPTVRD